MEKTVDNKVQKAIMKEKMNKTIKIFLVNGYQMSVVLCEEDDTCIVVAGEKGRMMIYKHAISSIVVD